MIYQERNWRNLLINSLFLLPGLSIYICFFFYPAIQNLAFSFYRMDSFISGKFIGLENFRTMLTDELFHVSVFHALYFMVLYATIPIILGLAVAIILARAKVRGITIFRCVYFMPYVITGIAVGMAFHWVFLPVNGLLNSILEFLGLSVLQRAWLGDVNTAIHAVGSVGIWATFGFIMLIFLAGLQRLDNTLYEAAKVDGANIWNQIIHITIPSLKNEITVALVLNIIAGLRNFGLVLAMTHTGGPGTSTMVMSLYAIRVAFNQNNFGYGAALTLVITLICLIVTFLVMWARREQN